MALCSGAELLLPTYFMTSCAPHANNSASPLSTVHRLPSLTLSAHFFSLHCHCLSVLNHHKNGAIKMYSNCASEQMLHN